MAIDLPDETTERLVASIRRYFKQERDEDLGELPAKLLLDFILQEIAPSIYNTAITDAQTYIRDRLADLDGACFQPEFGYWGRKKGAKG